MGWFVGQFVVRLALRKGAVYVAADGTGGAVWIRPGERVAARAAVRAGLLAMPFRVGWGGLGRSMNLSGHLDTVRQRSAPREHVYLMALGVDPSVQRRGIGAALIRPVLARADTAGAPCYLETFSERNLAFYEKHGFGVSTTGRIPKGGPGFWTMVREPREVR